MLMLLFIREKSCCACTHLTLNMHMHITRTSRTHATRRIAASHACSLCTHTSAAAISSEPCAVTLYMCVLGVCTVIMYGACVRLSHPSSFHIASASASASYKQLCRTEHTTTQQVPHTLKLKQNHHITTHHHTHAWAVVSAGGGAAGSCRVVLLHPCHPHGDTM